MLANRFAYLALTTFGEDIRHPEHVEYAETFQRIRDCLDNRVKCKGKVYLPDPSEGNEEQAFKDKRYALYIQRACFLPVLRRTRDGLVAQVFIRKPTVVEPENKSGRMKHVTSEGTSVTSLANNALAETVSLGRCCLLVAYTELGEKAVIDLIQAEDIITWAAAPVGMFDELGRNLGSATVRIFLDVMGDDGVTVNKIVRLLQYSLDKSGVVWVREKRGGYEATSVSRVMEWSAYERVMVNGEPLRHIPVYPIGSEENTFTITTPPLAEMAELNVSHFINSADYEEFAKLAGQVTPVFSGLREDWYTKHIEGKVKFGSRTPVGLNEGATATLLQAQPNSVAKEAMDKKETMMVSIGARLIEERKIRKTATESNIEDKSYHSILGHIALNVNSAVNLALDLYARYDKVAAGSYSVTLNTDFSTVSSDAEHRRLLLEEYIAGTRTFAEYREALRAYDVSLQEDDAQAQVTIADEYENFRSKLAPAKETVSSGDNRTKPTNKED